MPGLYQLLVRASRTDASSALALARHHEAKGSLAVARTAGHCVEGLTRGRTRRAVLVLERHGVEHRFEIVGARAFGEGTWAPPDAWLNSDVGVLHLDRRVPPEVAVPRPLAWRPATPGEEVTQLARA